VEVELQAVATQSPSKALAVLESFLEDVRSQEGSAYNVCGSDTLSAAVALGEMQGELDAEHCERLFLCCKRMGENFSEKGYLDTSECRGLSVSYLAVTLGAVFGRRCGDPLPYIPRLLVLCEPGQHEGWAAAALAEIAARGEGHLSEYWSSMNGQRRRGRSLLNGSSIRSSEILIERVTSRILWILQIARALIRPSSLYIWQAAFGAFRLLGQLGDMSHEKIIMDAAADLIADYKASFGNEMAEKLRDEATSAASLIRSRVQQHQLDNGEGDGDAAGEGDGDAAGGVDDDAAERGGDAAGEGYEDSANQEATDLARALKESDEYADQQESASLADALLRSKIDMESGNEVVLLRLTSYSDEVETALLESEELAACRAAVLEAGCDLVPSWGNGAKMFVPVALGQLPEQERLQVHHIIIRRSDKVHLQAALLTVSKKKRPKFRHVSVTQVANPKIPSVSVDAADGDTLHWSDDSSEILEEVCSVGVIVENTFLCFPVPKDCSETSDVLQSAPGGSGKEPINHRRWASQKKSKTQP